MNVWKSLATAIAKAIVEKPASRPPHDDAPDTVRWIEPIEESTESGRTRTRRSRGGL